MRIPCPLYQDDWVHSVSHIDFPNKIYWCPECDAIWFTKENLQKQEQMFGVTFTRRQSYESLIGDENFWSSTIDLGDEFSLDEHTNEQKDS